MDERAVAAAVEGRHTGTERRAASYPSALIFIKARSAAHVARVGRRTERGEATDESPNKPREPPRSR